jgi:ATP-binding cassette subfamily C protein LapB
MVFNAGVTDDSNRVWLKPVLTPLRPAFREAVAMALFVNLLALAPPVFILQVYDRVVFYAGLTTLQGLVIGMAVVLLFDLVLRQARSRLLQRVALRIDVAVGRLLFDKLMALPLRELEGRPAPYWQTLFRDVEVVRNAYSGSTAVLLTDLPFALLFVGFVFVIAAPIAPVLLIILPIFVLLAWRSTSALNAATGEERKAGFGRDAFIAEAIAGRTTVKALALDAALQPTWEGHHATSIAQSLVRGGKADAYSNLGIMLTLATTVVLTTVGALAIINQELSIGALIATNMLASRIVGPFQQLVVNWRGYAIARQSIERLGEALALPEERASGEIALERPRGEIHLESLGFRYRPDAPPVIDGIGLRILPRGLYALVGPNGSGKTTLIKLMQGLYRPEAGRVLLDGADIAQFSRRELARWIGYVPQELFLFTGTVRDNIAKARPEASDEEVLTAARLAGAHEFIIDLADGYGSDIGEAGTRLSAGIRQRLAIARALLGDPPVLLLDEPSNNLDRQAEEALAETLATLARDHTVLVVTHSRALLSRARDILGLDKGKIAFAGPARELLPRLVGARRSEAARTDAAGLLPVAGNRP